MIWLVLVTWQSRVSAILFLAKLLSFEQPVCVILVILHEALGSNKLKAILSGKHLNKEKGRASLLITGFIAILIFHLQDPKNEVYW